MSVCEWYRPTWKERVGGHECTKLRNLKNSKFQVNANILWMLTVELAIQIMAKFKASNDIYSSDVWEMSYFWCLITANFVHCIRSVRIWGYSGPQFSAFGLNTERYSVSLCIQSKCGKMRTRTTPNTDIFQALYDTTSISVRKINWIWKIFTWWKWSLWTGGKEDETIQCNYKRGRYRSNNINIYYWRGFHSYILKSCWPAPWDCIKWN